MNVNEKTMSALRISSAMKILPADEKDFSGIRTFYHELTDICTEQKDTIGWKKDIYPSPSYLHAAISARELYIGILDEQLMAAMILDHHCNESYRDFLWPVTAADNEISVIHALGVHPRYQRKGYAKEMVAFVIDTARQNRQKVLRLDVLEGNTAAMHLYESMGFKYRHTLRMYYEDTGWTNFLLYEYVLTESDIS